MTIRSLAIEVPLFWRSRVRAADPLVQRLQAGDLAAVGEAYDANHAAVRAFACRLVGDRDEAEDLVQQVFVTLPKAVRRFDGRSSLRTYLISIAINHARHHVRAAARRRRAMERSAEGRELPSTTPETATADRELAGLLSRALDALPIDQRVAFVLCEVEERTSVEAAAILGIPEATVRTRLFHARRKLRDALSREGVR